MKVLIKVKRLTNKFNGVDITQSKDFIKIHMTSYIERVIERHMGWMKNYPTTNEPLPMKCDKTFTKNMEQAEAPLDLEGRPDLKAINAIEKEFEFEYKSATHNI